MDEIGLCRNANSSLLGFLCSNNAGLMSGNFQLTEDGLEKTFATNYVGT